MALDIRSCPTREHRTSVCRDSCQNRFYLTAHRPWPVVPVRVHVRDLTVATIARNASFPFARAGAISAPGHELTLGGANESETPTSLNSQSRLATFRCGVSNANDTVPGAGGDRSIRAMKRALSARAALLALSSCCDGDAATAVARAHPSGAHSTLAPAGARCRGRPPSGPAWRRFLSASTSRRKSSQRKEAVPLPRSRIRTSVGPVLHDPLCWQPNLKAYASPNLTVISAQ